jgi:hypothetical protein
MKEGVTQVGQAATLQLNPAKEGHNQLCGRGLFEAQILPSKACYAHFAMHAMHTLEVRSIGRWFRPHCWLVTGVYQGVSSAAIRLVSKSRVVYFMLTLPFIEHFTRRKGRVLQETSPWFVKQSYWGVAYL